MGSDVQAGNHQSAQHTQPKLWQMIEALPPAVRPAFLRGDCVFGNEPMLLNCEQRQLGYLFKLRMTKNVKALVKLVASSQAWSNAGQGWQGVESQLELSGWSRTRRVIVLRRRLEKPRKPAR